MLPARSARRALLAAAWLASAMLAGCDSASLQATTLPADWVWPFPADTACLRIVRPFSVENPWDHAHEAVDFGCPAGTPVLAAASGEVASVSQVQVGQEMRGRLALRLDAQTLRLEYLNLSAVLAEEGDHLEAGARLGDSALGLHLAVLDESSGEYVDPLIYLPTLPAD